MVAFLLESFFVAAALLHFYWAAGGRWGIGAALPELPGKEGPRPGPGATVAVAAALLLGGLLVAFHAGWLPVALPRAWSRAMLWAACAMFALRALGDFRLLGFFKRIRGTRFATFDTWLYSPLCAALALGLGTLARS